MKSEDPAHTSQWMAWLPLAAMPMGAAAASVVLQPWVFMWVLAISIYFGLKWLSWWRAKTTFPHTAWRSVAYLLAWPGMDAETFLERTRTIARPQLRDWFWAILETALGAIFFWGVARALFQQRPLLAGWCGMLGLVLLLHFGTFQLAALGWQSLGVKAMPIMSAPLSSRSLSEFWGKRWNLGFRQLSHSLIFGPLHKNLGAGTTTLLVFFISGILHDLVISLPARGGYGLPTGYFVLQGLGVLTERSLFGKRIGLREGFRGWIFMAVFTAAPVFWLFHPPFVMRVIIPFMKWMGAL